MELGSGRFPPTNRGSAGVQRVAVLLSATALVVVILASPAGSALIGAPSAAASGAGYRSLAPAIGSEAIPSTLVHGSDSTLSDSWPLRLSATTNVSSVCAFAGTRCPSAPSTVRVHLTVHVPTTAVSSTDAAQVLFLLDESPMMVGCELSGECYVGTSDAFSTFKTTAGQDARAIQLAHPGVNITFGLATTQSPPGEFDDGDSVPFGVPVANFTNASLFGPAVNRTLMPNGDEDMADNGLQSGLVTALYASFAGAAANTSYLGGSPKSLAGPVNWTLGDNHVVVWVGAAAPVDANYTEYPCPILYEGCSATTTNTSMGGCASSEGITGAMPTCQGWITSQDGNPLDSIADLSVTASACFNSSFGHCTFDAVIVNATSTDPSSRGWSPKNVSGWNTSDVRADADHIISAGCDMAAFTGGSWDGPRSSTCGNRSGTLAYSANSSDPTLVSSLGNISLGSPGSGMVAVPPPSGPMFQFVTAPAFTVAPSLDANATCTSAAGPLTPCPQTPAVRTANGSTVLGWNWSTSADHSAMLAGDSWDAWFNLEASGAPSSVAAVDICATIECLAGASATSGIQFQSGRFPVLLHESFPLVTESIAAAPGLSGSLVPPTETVDALSPLALQAVTSGGYPPFVESWSFGDGTFQNASSAFANHTYATSGFYHMVVSLRDASGAALNLSRWVTVLSPLVTTVVPVGATGSFPLPVLFAASPSGGLGPYQVVWQFGDGSTGTGLSLEHTFAGPGSYTVLASVADSLGGTVGESVNVTVVSPQVAPALSANATVNAVAAGSCSGIHVEYHFVGTANGGTAPYTFTWAFGDGTTATGATVVHVYLGGPAPSSNVVPTLMVTDASGATANATAPLPTAVFAPPPCHTVTTSAPAPFAGLLEIGALSALVLVAVVAVLLWRRRAA
ncbi:MAG: PKD domain-containing protein [Thermoplasmata archaeon]|nr:PKD domain-containing protein [Thermoplasmata archaeon]